MQRAEPVPVADGVRVVVTGGAGFLGSHAVDALAEAGARVLVLDDLSTGDPANLGRSSMSAVDVAIADVRSETARRAVATYRPQVVVHLAAQVGVPSAVRDPLTDADVNVRGTVNILQAAADAGAMKVIFACSSAIYGQVREAALPVSEEHLLAPASPYGLSKATGLAYVEWFDRHRGLAGTSLVLGNVYGPRQQPGRGGVVTQFLDAARCGRPVLIRDGSQTRDFVHVTDVADAIVRACRGPAAGRVNIGSGRETSIDQLHRLLVEITGRDVPARHTGARRGELRRMRLAVGRACQRLGWQARITLGDGLRALAEEPTTRAVAP